MSFIVAIDGPAGAGKSTLARRVARALGLVLVDTGAIYRCVALRAHRDGVDWNDDAGLEAIVRDLRVSFRFEGDLNQVRLDGEDVTGAIRTPEMSRGASMVSARPPVRAGLLDLQRKLARAEPRGAVLEGRDIGTVVFPDASLKIFLTASPEARARRRFEELGGEKSGGDAATGLTYDRVLEDLSQRDRVDETRAIAPLRPADDAHHVDTTALSPEQVVELVVSLARKSGDFPQDGCGSNPSSNAST